MVIRIYRINVKKLSSFEKKTTLNLKVEQSFSKYQILRHKPCFSKKNCNNFLYGRVRMFFKKLKYKEYIKFRFLTLKKINVKNIIKSLIIKKIPIVRDRFLSSSLKIKLF